MVNFKAKLKAVEKKVYYEAFKFHNYNQTKAAQALGVSRGTFRTKMKNWGMLS